MADPRITRFAEEAALGDGLRERLEQLLEELTAERQPTRHSASSSDPSTTWTDHGSDVPAPTFEEPSERYQTLGELGQGNMGQVLRVLDAKLDRVVAMKTALPRLAERPSSLARFLAEAQTTAQLQHPNIVPVHDMGRDPDGLPWFTMREVSGRTLTEVIDEVHAASQTTWGRSPSGWTLRRLIAATLQVCHAIAYAHQRGVIHRDLKPDNVMVGSHGQVYVVDWGLAKVVELAEAPEDDPAARPVTTSRSRSQSLRTQVGAVTGTPAYMAPEQARGDVDKLDARTDVYALGAMLYHVLTGGPPHDGADVSTLLARIIAGAVQAPAERRPTLPIPAELEACCLRAMSTEPDDRFQDVTLLAEALETWLDGARRREQALAVLADGLALESALEQLRADADRARRTGAALLEECQSYDSEERKAAGWELQDRADAIDEQIASLRIGVERSLHAALRIAPELSEAHAALVERAIEQHRQAELAGDRTTLQRAAATATDHSKALAPQHPTRIACAAYLEGTGALTLVTDPPGAEVLLFRYETRNRRLVEVFDRQLGTTPLQRVDLPMGSYVAVIKHPDRASVRYPIHLGRQEHWDGIAPGDTDPTPVWLPRPGNLPHDGIYVPAGWFHSGGDPAAAESLPARRLWCDALVFQRHPVTNRDYLRFLDHLVDQGREDDALRYASQERSPSDSTLGSLLLDRTPDGHFALGVDPDGTRWEADWPTICITWDAAHAYLRWLAEKSGHPWRLPGDLEWEKAARGVDGRAFPWGDFHDPSWCMMARSHRGTRAAARVDDFPVDCSPYGVRGMAGNAQDWCAEPFASGPALEGDRVLPPTPDPNDRSLRVTRGGAWEYAARSTRVCFRYPVEPWTRLFSVGFRGAYRPRAG